jgi:prepilin-type N-terminal cleavage/methylation domain-containing protein
MTLAVHPRRQLRRPRKGFTLAELVVSLVLCAILGTAVTRLLVAQSRLYEIQKARRDARAVGRTSLNLLFSDLRMAHDGSSAPGSVVIASPETLKVRVPYAVGLVCGQGNGSGSGNSYGNTPLVISMFPADSSTRAAATYAGFAWFSRLTRQYTYVPLDASSPALPVTSTAPTTCTTTASIKTDTLNGRYWGPTDVRPTALTAQPGAPAFFYQEVMYWFGPSTTFTGRVGLWRKATGGGAEELIAPFANTARFKFYQRSVDTPSLTAPAVLDSLVGVAFVLNGATDSNIPGAKSVKTSMETSVFFKNRRGF